MTVATMAQYASDFMAKTSMLRFYQQKVMIREILSYNLTWIEVFYKKIFLQDFLVWVVLQISKY